MARTKRKELEKEAKRKGELSKKGLNVEKSVAGVALLPIQPSVKCEDSTAESDCRPQQSLSQPEQGEVVKCDVVEVEGHGREHQQSTKEATLCYMGEEMVKVREGSSTSLLQSSHPHAPLSTLQKLNTSGDTFMSEKLDDSKPPTYYAGKVVSTKKSQSMTLISSQRVLFPASVSSPSQLPRAVVCVEDICKSPDGNIFKIFKRQSSKEPAETEGINCGSEQNSLDLSDTVLKNPVSGLSLTGDRTVSSSSTTKNIFEQFDTEIIGRRSPRLRSNSPRGNYSQGSPVFQDTSSQSSSEDRHHSSIASAVRALRGISERVSEVRTHTGVKSQESKPVTMIMSDSKEDNPESLPLNKHSPQASADISPPERGSKTSKSKKTSASPTHSDICDPSALGLKRARSPGRLSDDVAQVSLERCHRDERLQSPNSKKAKVDSVVAKSDTCLFHIMSSTSPQVRLQSKGMQIGAQASSFLKESDQGCLSSDVQSSGSDARIVSPVKSGDQGNERHSLLSPSHSQPQNSGIAESTDGAEPSLLCAMLLGGSEVAKTYEQSRDHVHAHIPTSKQHKSVVPSSSTWSAAILPSDELMADHSDSQTPYELPLLSHLPPLVKPNCAVLDLTLNEPVPCEEGNGFACAFSKRNMVLLGLISKVADYLKQFGSVVDRNVIEDAEKILCEDHSEVGKQNLKAESKQILELPKTAIDCDAESKDCPQEVQCKKYASKTCTSITENTVIMDGVVENVGTDSDKKNLVVGHQPSSKQLQETIQDKPDAELAHADGGMVESPSPSAKQKNPVSHGDLIPTSTVETSLTVQNGDNQMTEALRKNRSITGSSSLVNQSSVDRISEHMSESSHSFAEDSVASMSGSRIPKSDPSPVRPGLSRHQWQPKVQSTPNRGRPLWSRWHKIHLPSPLVILTKPEQPSVNKKLSPFISKELDAYLRICSNRLIVPAGPKSKLAKILVLHGFFRDYSQLEAELNKCTACGHCSGDDCPGKTDEEEDNDEEKDDFPQKFEPDFDEVHGLVFMSFANEIGLQSHIQVEKDLKWDKEPNAFLNIARFRAFEESRREDSTSRRESQGLRGQHMRWRKYQRMYRKEFRGRQEAKERGLPWPLPKMPSKTSDVSKIKNWKQKLERDGIKTEETSTSQNGGCGGSETASHKKKKRKTYIFSVKKKSKKSAPPPEKACRAPAVLNRGGDERSVESSVTRPASEMHEEDDYGKPIPIDQDGYMEDVQNSLKEMEEKQKGVMLNKILFSHLKMGPEDVDIFKRLGGWVTCQKTSKKGSGDKKSKNRTISSHSAWNSEDEMKLKRQGRFKLDLVAEERAREAVLAVQRYEDVRDAHATLHFSSDSNDMSIPSNGGDFMDLTGDSPSPASSHKAKDSCDKPGCRYGCICHLCQSIGESDDLDQAFSATPQGHTCDKEYCRLGCICDSLEKSSKRPSPPHCRKPACVLECQCLKEVPDIPGSLHPLVKAEADDKNLHAELKSEKADSLDLAESSGDELPTLEKTNSRRQRSLDRYSNLPRRQTSYRIAKNLDAVSRKAMMLYETSEIYWEQSCNRRKKSSDSPGGSSATPCTATTATPTHAESMTGPTDPCVSAASTAFTSVLLLPQPGLAQTAADHSIASLPVSTSSVTSFSGLVSISPSSASPTMRGSDICCQNKQKTSQEPSPVIISDDEGLVNKVSGMQHLQESPKSARMKNMSVSEPCAGAAAKQTTPQLTTTTCQPAVASTPFVPSPPLVASATPGGLTSPVSSQTRWHTSMVCLRANPPGKDRRSVSDDVQEEDEIKLLEFIANCNWDGAKKNILLQVAQCLSRAQYPAPRTMFVGDFRVEILPKASKPSLIPPELRNKLPEMMYSIRVRVTQYRNSATNLHPVGLYRNAATAPSGMSARLAPASVVATAVPACKSPGTNSASKSDLQEKLGDTSLGISGLGQLQISHCKSAAPVSLPGEAFLMQGKKIKNKRGLDSADDQEAVRKKKKKKKSGAEASSKPAAGSKGKKDSSVVGTPVPIKLPIISIPNSIGTTQAFPISKLTPLIPGVSSQQVIGPVANLKDLKFIQLPGQKSLLQLLPASALGIKPADGKGSPQFLAVPVPIAPVPVKGDGKRMGTKAQIDVPLGAQVFGGVSQKSARQTASVGGPVQPAAVLPVNSALVSNTSSKKKKKKKKKKEVVESAETSRIPSSVGGSDSATPSAAPKACGASVSVGLEEQFAPYPLHVVPNVAARCSNTEGVPAGLKTPAPISSVLFGNQIISISSPGRQSITAGGEPVAAVTKAKPHSASSLGCKELSGLAAKQLSSKAGCSLLGTPRSLLSTTAKILSSTSPGGLESNTGEKVVPVLPLSQNVTFAGDYPTHVKGKTSKANRKSRPSSSSKPRKLPEKRGKSFDEDSLASVGSQGSLSSNSILLSEDEAADLEQENHMSGDSSLVSSAAEELEKTRTSQSKNKSRVHLVHKQREKNRRAEHYRMFQQLKDILFSIDLDRKLLPSLPKTKLLSKAELVVKYHQKRSQSLEKTYTIEQKRHSLLKQQLESKIDDLKKEGVTEDTIGSILKSLRVSCPPRVPVDNQLSAEEQRLLSADYTPSSSLSNKSTVEPDSYSNGCSRLRSGSVASMLLYPWQVDGSTGSSEESNSSLAVSLTSSSTSRAASPGGNRCREKRRKSTKPVKLKSKPSSQFVIEIERADEDVNFVDVENSNCTRTRRKKVSGSVADVTMRSGGEHTDVLKRTLPRSAFATKSADVNAGNDCKDAVDSGVKETPSDLQSVQTSCVSGENSTEGPPVTQKQSREESSNKDKMHSNQFSGSVQDSCSVASAVDRGSLGDLTAAMDDEFDMQ